MLYECLGNLPRVPLSRLLGSWRTDMHGRCGDQRAIVIRSR
jgi:hypothetical protein